MEYRGKGSTECWEATSYEKRGSCLPLKFQIDYWYLVYQSLNKRGFLLSSLLKALTPILSFHNFPFSLNSTYTFINGLCSQVWRQNVEGYFHRVILVYRFCGGGRYSYHRGSLCTYSINNY